MTNLIPYEKAAALIGVSPKRLLGYLMRNKIALARLADSAPAAPDPERVEIARCPRCSGLPRPTLMGRMICDRCGGLDVQQPPSPTVLRQIETMETDSASVQENEAHG